MSASSRKIMDFFKEPASKRLKSVPSQPAKLPITTKSLHSEDHSPNQDNADPQNSIDPVQKSRMELNKAAARAKRNLKLCSTKCTLEGEGRQNVNLFELLVEESWVKQLSCEFQKPYMKNLCKFVEGEIAGGSSVPVYPPQNLIFNAFNTISFDMIKVVIVGQDPYHGPGQAMGLSFSVPNGVKVPSSLLNIFKELHNDLGCSIPIHGNLEQWALQGVLLLNAVLTVKQHQANSHANKGWETFTDAVIKTISTEKNGVVFLLWGNYAQAKARLIDDKKHYLLKCAHPSGLSANRGFFGCRHFSKTNQILEKMGVSPINWQL